MELDATLTAMWKTLCQHIQWQHPVTIGEHGVALSALSREECLFPDYKASKKDPSGDWKNEYTQMRIPGAAQETPKVYCHRLALLMRTGGTVEDLKNFEQEHEASHYFCSKRRCCNPFHLTKESHLVNKSRLCCAIFGETEEFVCPHNPPCPHTAKSVFPPL